MEARSADGGTNSKIFATPQKVYYPLPKNAKKESVRRRLENCSTFLLRYSDIFVTSLVSGKNKDATFLQLRSLRGGKFNIALQNEF